MPRTIAFLATLALVAAVPVVVSGDPTLPFTPAEEQDYIKQGMVFEYEHKSREDKNVEIAAEVTATGEEGFVCAIRRGGEALTGTAESWDGDLDVRELKLKWGALADQMAGAEVGKEEFKLGKTKVTAVTYKSYRNEGRLKRGTMIYVAAEFPGVLLRRDRWIESDRGKQTEKTTLTLKNIRLPAEKLEELQKKIPFDAEACRKFLVKGMKLTFDFIDGQKISVEHPGRLVPVSYEVEILEVNKDNHVEKAPTRWENGAPVEYAGETVQWAAMLDSYQEFLVGDATVTEENLVIGDVTVACVTISGSRAAGASFTEALKLSYSKDYPGLLVFKEIICTNTSSNTQTVNRLALKSIKKP